MKKILFIIPFLFSAAISAQDSIYIYNLNKKSIKFQHEKTCVFDLVTGPRRKMVLFSVTDYYDSAILTYSKTFRAGDAPEGMGPAIIHSGQYTNSNHIFSVVHNGYLYTQGTLKDQTESNFLEENGNIKSQKTYYYEICKQKI